jgi:adenosylcobinamide-phosphate synthase
MLAYKAVNTLDSMVGYRSEKHIDFGMASARLDDIANFLPSRITALLMICASFLLGLDWTNAFKVFLRDRKRHLSPNAGHPEATVAGALRIRLGGPSSYGGVVVGKPFIGDDSNPVTHAGVNSSIQIMHLTALLMAFSAFLVRVLVIFVL